MSQTHELKHPITIGGSDLLEVTLRRPKARDLRRFDAGSGNIAQSIDLMSDLAELPPSTIDELDAEDFQALSGILSGFLGKSPQISTAS